AVVVQRNRSLDILKRTNRPVERPLRESAIKRRRGVSRIGGFRQRPFAECALIDAKLRISLSEVAARDGIFRIEPDGDYHLAPALFEIPRPDGGEAEPESRQRISRAECCGFFKRGPSGRKLEIRQRGKSDN